MEFFFCAIDFERELEKKGSYGDNSRLSNLEYVQCTMYKVEIQKYLSQINVNKITEVEENLKIQRTQD